MGLTVSVADYPVREWIDSDTQSGTLKLTMTVTRDDPNAVTLRVCVGQNCVDIDISDIQLGQSAQKTATVTCCDSAGTIQAQKQTINTCPGDTYTISAPADKAVAYDVILSAPQSPGDAPAKGVVLPGKSVTFKFSQNAEGCVDQEYYELDPATVLANLSVAFKLLDANGNELDSQTVTITDARPFAVQAYSGNVEVNVSEVL